MHLFDPEWFYVINFDIFFCEAAPIRYFNIFFARPHCYTMKKEIKYLSAKRKIRCTVSWITRRYE